jgi:serine/threonine protein kinase
MEESKTKVKLESKYKVEWKRPLGEGGFGTVFLGTDKKTGELVAVKKISKQHTDDSSFQQEMNAFHQIRMAGNHPNICGLRENFDEGQYYYLVLDLVRGGEMFDHLIENGAYSEADAARLVREVGSALAFLHGVGLVHGDLKPEVSEINRFHLLA